VHEVTVALIAMINARIVKIRFIFVVFRFENKPDEWEIQGCCKTWIIRKFRGPDSAKSEEEEGCKRG
jgi:hypothetical protein